MPPSPIPDPQATARAAEETRVRQRWMAVLARAGAARIEAKLADVSADLIPPYRAIRAPETGMVMTQARAGGTGARFNAGEMTVTRCSIALDDGTVGHAYVAGRDHRHAELAAVLDGALQTDVGPRLLAAIVDPLAAEQAALREHRARQTGATKVEFFTMVRGED